MLRICNLHFGYLKSNVENNVTRIAKLKKIKPPSPFLEKLILSQSNMLHLIVKLLKMGLLDFFFASTMCRSPINNTQNGMKIQ